VVIPLQHFSKKVSGETLGIALNQVMFSVWERMKVGKVKGGFRRRAVKRLESNRARKLCGKISLGNVVFALLGRSLWRVGVD